MNQKKEGERLPAITDHTIQRHTNHLIASVPLAHYK